MDHEVPIDERDERDRLLIRGLVDFAAVASIALRVLPPKEAAIGIAHRLIAIRREWLRGGTGQVVDQREAFLAPEAEAAFREILGQSDEPSVMAQITERTWSRGAE